MLLRRHLPFVHWGLPWEHLFVLYISPQAFPQSWDHFFLVFYYNFFWGGTCERDLKVNGREPFCYLWVTSFHQGSGAWPWHVGQGPFCWWVGILSRLEIIVCKSSCGEIHCFHLYIHCWSCSVAQSRPTLCDPMDCSTPGFPVLHHLPELAQIHVYWVIDAIQPSHPLLPPSPPALNLSQHQGLFQWVSSSHQMAYASRNVKSAVSLTSLLPHQFSYGGDSPPASLENIFSLREYAQKRLPHQVGAAPLPQGRRASLLWRRLFSLEDSH